jgi:hypothetical protein
LAIKKRWLFLAPMAVLLGFYFGHKILTRMVFEGFCENKTGVFVYEKVELDTSYFMSIEKARKVEVMTIDWITIMFIR